MAGAVSGLHEAAAQAVGDEEHEIVGAVRGARGGRRGKQEKPETDQPCHHANPCGLAAPPATSSNGL